MLYIGIDLGTSACKLLLVDEKGCVRNTVSKEYPLCFPHPGWSEQDPRDWWTACREGVPELLAGFDAREVRGMGVGGQMHGLVALDETDAVLRPAILWNDGRTAEETAWLNDTVGRPVLSARTGNIAFAGFTAPKLLWMKKHEPELFARIGKIMLPKDYLVYCLTGVHATDYSDASGMLLLDVEHKCWSRDMLALCGISESQMPRLYESFAPVGTLLPETAAALGLPQGVTVCAGAGDNAAAAVGTGTVSTGAAHADSRCNISLGTSGTIFISSEKFGVDATNGLHAFAHADGGWHLMGCMLSAASCNKWWQDAIIGTNDYKGEEAKIAPEMLGRNHVYFLPYLMGERSPMALSERRRAAIKAAYGEGLYECPVTVENELDARRAVEDVQAAGVNALVVFLGNFGPETPETLIAEWFSGPIMYAAAAEGDGDLHDGRGDAYCGMLNCSYNLGLRGKTAYIPEYPVGTAPELAEKVAEFVPIARAILGLRGLKLITFGPRPDDFLACNGPIKALYDLGVAVEENSELDLLVAYNKHADDPRIPAKMAEMQAELGGNNKYAGVLPRLAQYELTLLDWAEAHKGARQYVAFANKCWPAFQTEFKFVPCYVNSRLAAMGIPVSCEVDIYGALSEYIGVCVSGAPTTLLDINNTVPASIYDKAIGGRYDVRLPETFMGFHCGNTSCAMLKDPHMGYQLIMKRDLEPELPEPDITRGTMEGNIKPGDITFFRLQSTADTQLKAYVAQGQVLDVDCESFGSIGAFAIPEMDRFYRHVLIAKRYPHHGAVAFGHWGKALFEVFKYLGVTDIAYNQPRSLPYPGENPFV